MPTYAETELVSQPDMWSRAVALLPAVIDGLPRRGESVAVVGCGTSWFMAMSYAALREAAGHGLTDAFAGSEFPLERHYDRIVALTRSGTTTEIVDLLHATTLPTVVVVGDASTPAARAADASIALPFADERSVVQTRFATSALALLRASLGEDLSAAVEDARAAVSLDVTPWLDSDQITFLGRGWTIGLAQEAALKTREAAQFWSEAYPAMDYRHGPISIAQPGRLTWMFGDAPSGLEEEVSRMGAEFVTSRLDPMAHLIVAQRVAIAKGQAKGFDVDNPRNLTRAVILEDAVR